MRRFSWSIPCALNSRRGWGGSGSAAARPQDGITRTAAIAKGLNCLRIDHTGGVGVHSTPGLGRRGMKIALTTVGQTDEEQPKNRDTTKYVRKSWTIFAASYVVASLAVGFGGNRADRRG